MLRAISTQRTLHLLRQQRSLSLWCSQPQRPPSKSIFKERRRPVTSGTRTFIASESRPLVGNIGTIHGWIAAHLSDVGARSYPRPVKENAVHCHSLRLHLDWIQCEKTVPPAITQDRLGQVRLLARRRRASCHHAVLWDHLVLDMGAGNAPCRLAVMARPRKTRGFLAMS